MREASNLDGNFIERFKLRIVGLIYMLSDQVISLSEGVKENLIRRYKIKEKDIKVIYNPIDLDAINRKISEGKMIHEHQEIFDSERKNIITAGRLVPQKDQETLIKAFAQVNKQIESRLIILGEGPLEHKLKNLAKTLRVSEYVHFIGFQQNPYYTLMRLIYLF